MTRGPDSVRVHVDPAQSTNGSAAKAPALRYNPAVALTIDIEVHPPRILLIRGRAELDVVEGIPDEYLQTAAPTR